MFGEGTPAPPDPERVRRAAEASLPFRAGQVDESWSSLDGRVAVWAWSNEPRAHGDPLLNVGTDQVSAHSGYAIGRLDAMDPSASGGVWAHFMASPGQITATTCSSGAEGIFFAETKHYVMVGSRAQLVHLLTREGSPDFDLGGLAAIVNAGFSTIDKTIFRGVRAVPPGARLKAVHGAPLLIQATASPGQPLERRPHEVADVLIKSVTGFPATAGTIRLGLTGGRDSRLLAALLVKAGVPVRTYTSGNADDPDVVIARKVAEVLEIEHTLGPPRGVKSTKSLISVDPRARVREAVALAEGMLGAFDRVGRIDEPFHPELIPLSGSGGEILRGYYANALQGVESPDAGRRVMRKRVLANEKFLTIAARQEYAEDLEQWFQDVARSPGNTLADFYIRQRTARWSGAARSASAMGSLAWRPFFDHHVVRTVRDTSLHSRTSERLFASLLDELAPELTDVPFVGKRWAFEHDPPTDPTARASWESRAPIVGRRGESPSFNWRTDLVEVRDELRSVIEAAPDQFWQLMDEQAVSKLFMRLPQASRAQTLALWNMATVAHTLASNAELGPAKFDIAPTAISVEREPRATRRRTHAPGRHERLRTKAKTAYLRIQAYRTRRTSVGAD